MTEWQIVAAAGALGGFLSTFFAGGMDVPSPPIIGDFLKDRPLRLFAYHVMRNTLCGGIASLGVWLGNNHTSAPVFLSSVDWTGGQVLTALTVGGAGTSFISNLFREARVRSIDTMADTLGTVIEQNVRLREKLDELSSLLQGEEEDDD